MSGSSSSRVVIVGASLAGLRAAEELRTLGWAGTVVVIGDESHPPYDRPPLSKGVLTGSAAAAAPMLTRPEGLDVEWRLGVAASGLDREARRVRLVDGSHVEYDRLVIATGRRARPWADADEARLDGVVTLRTIEDAIELRQALAGRPQRVVVVGAGFIGSEVASAVRSLGLDVTVVGLGGTPLDGALGESVGAVAHDLYRHNRVDFRPGTTVRRILGGSAGEVEGVELTDGSTLGAEVVVVATGSLPNVEWLHGSGLDTDGGIAVDQQLRVLDDRGAADPDVFAAGDVTRWAHPIAADRLFSIEHWGNAVEQGRHVARAIVGGPLGEASFSELPMFWSVMFGMSIKSVGVPSLGDEVVLAQGSLSERRAVVLYGRRGRTVAAVAFDAPRELEFFTSMVTRGAPFPPRLVVADVKGAQTPVPARFPLRGHHRLRASDGAGRGVLAPRQPPRKPRPDHARPN